jgi:hypothetical protein
VKVGSSDLMTFGSAMLYTCRPIILALGWTDRLIDIHRWIFWPPKRIIVLTF